MPSIVMPSNRAKLAKELNDKFPGRLGLLFSPGGFRDPLGLPFALDNGRFPVWARGAKWDEEAYLRLLGRPESPVWAAVPDVVADAESTFKEWVKWHPVVNRIVNCPLALVVQDGMTPLQVKAVKPRPSVIFIGGTFRWKRQTMKSWCRNFKRVHVGRVNTERMLWAVERTGAESSDGTGWWHRVQYEGLCRYLTKSSQGKERAPVRGFFY